MKPVVRNIPTSIKMAILAFLAPVALSGCMVVPQTLCDPVSQNEFNGYCFQKSRVEIRAEQRAWDEATRPYTNGPYYEPYYDPRFGSYSNGYSETGRFLSGFVPRGNIYQRHGGSGVKVRFHDNTRRHNLRSHSY